MPILIPVKDPGPRDIKIQFIFLISKLLFSNDTIKLIDEYDLNISKLQFVSSTDDKKEFIQKVKEKIN